MVSAPPASVTADHEPKLPQALPERGAEARSTTPLEVSIPAPESEPLPSVSGTERLVYHGPPARSAVWPVGAVVSLVRVKVAVAVEPAPLCEVTVWAPEAVVVLSQV